MIRPTSDHQVEVQSSLATRPTIKSILVPHLQILHKCQKPSNQSKFRICKFCHAMLVHIICRSAKYKYEPSNQFKFRSCANDICTLLAAFWIFLLTLCNCYKHLNTFVKSTSSSQHTCQHKHNIFGKDWLQNGTMTCTPVQCADEIQSCKKGFY